MKKGWGEFLHNHVQDFFKKIHSYIVGNLAFYTETLNQPVVCMV